MNGWRGVRKGWRLPVTLLAAWLLAMLWPHVAVAQTDAGRPNYTDVDWALLPSWCIDTQDGPFGSPSYSGTKVGRSKSPRSDHWTGLFGGDFWHLHHFCRGLYAERRLARIAGDPKQEISAINVALSEYRYLLLKCAPTMVLMPEVYVRMGALSLRKGDRVAAMDAYAAARGLRPDYWPAYTQWFDELMKLGLRDQARALVDEGLKHAPDEPQLRERKARLEHSGTGDGK